MIDANIFRKAEESKQKEERKRAYILNMLFKKRCEIMEQLQHANIGETD